jgi:Ca2+-binding EF-hand superfamily protein
LKIRNIITALALSLTVAATADEPAKAKNQGVDLSSRSESYETWFARYDENKDDKLTMDEFRGGKMLFTGYDTDRDGILTREEIKKAKSMSSRPSIRTLDTDKDGFVNRREWTGTQEEFDAVDLDNDGVWSKADLTIEKEKTRAKGLLERMDTDKDGVVSSEEWTATGRDAASFRRQDLNLNSTLDLEELATPVKAKKQ